jgi:hypothetical protein
LQFHSFDQEYLRRLAACYAAVEHHFSSYFGELLSLKLRVRIRSYQLIPAARRLSEKKAWSIRAVWGVRQRRVQ